MRKNPCSRRRLESAAFQLHSARQTFFQASSILTQDEIDSIGSELVRLCNEVDGQLSADDVLA